MLTGLLQVAYGMADNIVVGKFSPDPNALAALGSTGAINTMIINLLLGIAAGTGVVVSQFFGAKEYESVSKSVHTSMVISLIGGILFMTLGLVLSRPALELLDTK
jgi:Na+-driven multidrug efflux pump